MASMFSLFSPGATQPMKSSYMPKSTLKIDKDGIRFESSVDRVQYTMRALIAAANYDIAKLVIKRSRQEALKSRSIAAMAFSSNPVGKRKGSYSKRFKNMFSYWVRKRENDLQIGIKHGTWYGVQAEMGTMGQPKRGILRNTVYQLIPDIMKIQAHYLSAIEDDIKANGIVVETREEYYPDEEGDDPV